MLIAAVTATVWIGICWASPCDTAPPQQLLPVLQSQYVPNSLLQLASRVTGGVVLQHGMYGCPGRSHCLTFCCLAAADCCDV